MTFTTPQRPLGSGFGPASTAAEIMEGISLAGKTVIVTGAYSGLGKENARVFAAAGARVIAPARDRARASAALAGVAGVEVADLDLLSPVSIDAFVASFLKTGEPLHILVNNAAIMACPFERESRGYEIQFATNHLGHFRLVKGLLPALLKAQGARVVSVSSKAHRFSPVMFDDIHFENRPYDPLKAYGQSKTANVLFAVGLDDRYKDQGIRAFSVHPGIVLETNLAKHLAESHLRAAGALDANGKPVLDPAKQLKTVEQGASTTAWCATSPQLASHGGVYCENNDIAGIMTDEAFATTKEMVQLSGVRPYAIDREAADKLWELSERYH